MGENEDGNEELDERQVKLRKAREEAGLSRAKLGDLIGVSMRTIVRWEADPGKITEENYVKAMRAIRMSEASKPDADMEIDLSQVPLLTLAQEIVVRLQEEQRRFALLQGGRS